MTINFDILNRNYMWYSSLFQCHNTLDFFETTPGINLNLVRIKYTKLNFDPAVKVAEYALKFLSSNFLPVAGVTDYTVRISQTASGMINVAYINDVERIGEFCVGEENPDCLYAGIVNDNGFKLMEVSALTRDSLLVNFLIMDNDVVTEENTTSTKGRIILTDNDVEPEYTSDGYILPEVSLNSAI